MKSSNHEREKEILWDIIAVLIANDCSLEEAWAACARACRQIERITALYVNSAIAASKRCN